MKCIGKICSSMVIFSPVYFESWGFNLNSIFSLIAAIEVKIVLKDGIRIGTTTINAHCPLCFYR